MIKIENIKLSCISCCIPGSYEYNKDLEEFDEERKQRIIDSTGVKKRPIAINSQCTSDFVYEATLNIIRQKNIDLDQIGILVLVTQTPDYILPATSCILHNRLKLNKDTITFDINLGCSGYIYGLFIASSLLNMTNKSYALLLAGDTISKFVGKEDASTRFIFGDAGSATLLEKDCNAEPMIFSLGTDGSGWQNLIIPNGGSRNKNNRKNDIKIDNDGNKRSDDDLYMDGMEIFNFTISTIIPHIQLICDEYGLPDIVVFHQANKYMLEFMRKNLKIPKDKFLYSLEDFGNTSSASIPLTLCANSNKTINSKKALLSGFGVGYSYGSAIVDLKETELYNILTYKDCNE